MNVVLISRGGWGDWQACLKFLFKQFNLWLCLLWTLQIKLQTDGRLLSRPSFLERDPSFLDRDHCITSRFKIHFIFSLNTHIVFMKYGSPVRIWTFIS